MQKILHNQNLAQRTPVLVSYGCCNESSQTWWLKQQNFILSQSWRPEIWNQGPGRAAVWEDLFLASSSFWWLQDLCSVVTLHPLCVSYKDTPLDLGLRQVIQYDLISRNLSLLQPLFPNEFKFTAFGDQGLTLSSWRPPWSQLHHFIVGIPRSVCCVNEDPFNRCRNWGQECLKTNQQQQLQNLPQHWDKHICLSPGCLSLMYTRAPTHIKWKVFTAYTPCVNHSIRPYPSVKFLCPTAPKGRLFLLSFFGQGNWASVQISVLRCPIMSNSAILWTVACQAPLSMEFSRKDYWSGLPFPQQVDS